MIKYRSEYVQRVHDRALHDDLKRIEKDLKQPWYSVSGAHSSLEEYVRSFDQLSPPHQKRVLQVVSKALASAGRPQGSFEFLNHLFRSFEQGPYTQAAHPLLVNFLTERLGHRLQPVRYAASSAVVRLSSQNRFPLKAVPQLARGLKGDWTVGRDVVDALGHLLKKNPDNYQVGHLLHRVMNQHPEPDVRWRAASVLGRQGELAALPHVMAAVLHFGEDRWGEVSHILKPALENRSLAAELTRLSKKQTREGERARRVLEITCRL